MGTELGEEQAARIIQFGELLLRWSRAFNLISRKDQDRLYHRHLLDSLSVVPWLSGTRSMDLGTGAGLPGIPLAIACAVRSFPLIARNERKIRLVRQAIRLPRLENVEAVCGDVTRVVTEKQYDVVVTRAVASAADAWGLARASIAPGGKLLLMAYGQGEERGALAETAERVLDDGRIAARAALAIPGLPYPHGLLVIERAVMAPPDSTDN